MHKQSFIQYNMNIIDINQLRVESRTARGLIAPATEEVTTEALTNHTSEPIKRVEDINSIARHLKDTCRYRDYMLFIVGINFGLRVSDLRVLRFCDLINDNLTFKDSFPVFEKKTRNTRKRKKNRYITINDAVVEAVMFYLQNTPCVSLSDYMFRSESNHGSQVNEPLTARSIDRLLKGWADELGLGIKVSTHTLRKTFCYHQMLMSGNDHRKLLLLQKMLNHSSPAQTLDYIGITGEEIEEAYKQLNLGGQVNSCMSGCEIVEYESYVG